VLTSMLDDLMDQVQDRDELKPEPKTKTANPAKNKKQQGIPLREIVRAKAQRENDAKNKIGYDDEEGGGDTLGEEGYPDDQGSQMGVSASPPLSMTKRKKMNHVWKKNVRCYEELEAEYDEIEARMKEWAVENFAKGPAITQARNIQSLNEKEDAYFWAVTKERDPDVWPRKENPPFPYWIEQNHVFQELVDMPLPFEDETPEKHKTVKFYAYLKDMGLDSLEQGVFKELVGARYDEKTDMVKFVCRNYPSREQNFDGVKKLAWEVYEETKKLSDEIKAKPEYYEEEVEMPKPVAENMEHMPNRPLPIIRQTRFKRMS